MMDSFEARKNKKKMAKSKKNEKKWNKIELILK